MGNERAQSPQKDDAGLARHEAGGPPGKESSCAECQHPAPESGSPDVASPAGAPLTQNNILRLQRTVGNRAVARMLQRKVALSHPEEPSEREADRVADQVMTASDVASQPARPDTPHAGGGIQKRSLASSIKPLQREAAQDAGQDA